VKKYISLGFLSVLLGATVLAGETGPKRLNGFDVSNASIPVNDILSGGPPRDGIPSVDHPRFIRPADAHFMQDKDEVISISVNGETRAYPLRILDRHEIVNDQLSGKLIAITYCPLCGTAMVFNRQIAGRTLSFGVSGLLYQSDVLMYDRQTQSLWSQLKMSSISGPLVHTKLEWLPSQQLTWRAWKEMYPQGIVLSSETGTSRDYSKDAYVSYRQSSGMMFPAPKNRPELSPKEWVIGVLVNGAAHAYPINVLSRLRALEDGQVKITYDPESQQVTVENSVTGGRIPSVKVYWFAWQAFYPDTDLFK